MFFRGNTVSILSTLDNLFYKTDNRVLAQTLILVFMRAYIFVTPNIAGAVVLYRRMELGCAAGAAQKQGKISFEHTRGDKNCFGHHFTRVGRHPLSFHCHLLRKEPQPNEGVQGVSARTHLLRSLSYLYTAWGAQGLGHPLFVAHLSS